MRSDNQVSEVQTQIFDIFMELDSKNQEAEKKAACSRNLKARRAIEDHFERKRLERELIDFDFD